MFDTAARSAHKFLENELTSTFTNVGGADGRALGDGTDNRLNL